MRILKAISIRGFGALLVLILTYFSSLILPEIDFTVFTYAFALSALFGVFACHGGSQYMVKIAAIQICTENVSGYWSFFCRRAFKFWVLGNVLLLCVYFFGYVPEEVSVYVLLLSSLSALLFSFVQIYSFVMQGIGFINKSILFQSVLIPILTILQVLVVRFFYPVSVTVMMICYCAATLSVFLFIFLREFSNKKIDSLSCDLSSVKSFYPYMAISWLTLLLQNFSQFYSAKSLSVDAFAYISVVSRLSLIIGFALIIFNSVYSREIARLFSVLDFSGIRTLLLKSLALLSLLSIVFYLAVEFYGINYLVAFGVDEYAPIEVMKLIVLGQCINVAFGPALAILAMAGREKYYMYITIFSVALSLILTPLLITKYGVVGAGYSGLMGVALPSILAIMLLVLYSIRPSKVGLDV